ncbi:cation transporter [Polaribacter sp. BAL334]|uniref:cation diffusion facilitator family transporter n=1 Tax=Polaribacter sp. BAL334 TaxID=1708178 RepID=UPI0018D23C50|nr:cation diffusion facilitator family transporter [Polaribacter sp. BAL334]MBG7612827.1 cation transporter [Polaribacter sp. BAL334]
MGNHHSHHHSHQHSHHSSSSENIGVAFLLNTFFTIVEFIGGIYTNSMAIMSDAVHDLGDSVSLGMAWYFQKISKKKATKTYSYGFRRFSLLGAIINSTILLIGSILVIIKSIPRIISPEVSDAKGMMWFAVLGIIINGVAVLKLRKGTSINERVVALHLFEDVLGWLAILAASIIMQFYEIPVLDPILSIAIACYVLYNVFKNGKESFVILLQGVPVKISVEDVKTKLLENETIIGIKDCHIWTMDGEYTVFSAHLIVQNSVVLWEEVAILKADIRTLLHDEFQIEHVTLELDISEFSENIDCNSTL